MRHVAFALFLSLSPTCQAQNRSTEAGEASIKDPYLECQPYYYPPVSNSLSSFPVIWQPASILPNDTAAMNLWNSIAGGVPSSKIPVKGTLNGDFGSTMSTYPTSDPDCWWTYNHCMTPKLSGLPPDIYQVPEPRSLGYGFDDGPNCSHNAFYDYLQSQNQKATMFFIGSNVMDQPLEAQRALTDGHEICVHTWSHRYMTAFSSQSAFAELYYTIKAIELVIGITPTCWRPPYGDIDDRIRAIATGLGLRTVMWGYDSDDSRLGISGISSKDVDASYESFINSANTGQFNTTGAIILAHELSNFTMSEAVKYYPQLRASFKNIIPICAAMNLTSTASSIMPIATGSIPVSVLINGQSTSASASATHTSTFPTASTQNRASTFRHAWTLHLLLFLPVVFISM